ncbi:hypothetical protein [Azospirillum sp. SYSU D00513]|uniref:hypothetical protein n=1 Tax=Azospirillum sp. SYSU D00513 TaxID=2812561 RepID=UPI001A968DA5|nr:hypothetical protein [Azospirillum sp. SYSU D00513]
MNRFSLLLLFTVIGTSACQSTDTISVSKEIGTTTALLTTADLRIVTERTRPSVPLREGSGSITNHRVLCAEPSPDVAKALSTALTLGLTAQGRAPAGATGLEGGFNSAYATAESLAQLTDRVPAVQALRDGLFRACEAYANGSIGDHAYSLILSRYGDVLVTLLLGEAAAGSKRATLIKIDGQNLYIPPKTEGGGAQPSAQSPQPAPKAADSGNSDSMTAIAKSSETARSELTNHAMMTAQASGRTGQTDGENSTPEEDQSGAAADQRVFFNMQNAFIKRDSAGSMMVLCANVLDPTRPQYSINNPLHRSCEDFFSAISQQIGNKE